MIGLRKPISLLAFILSAYPVITHAQSVTGISSVQIDATGSVNAYAITELDYAAELYYKAVVMADLGQTDSTGGYTVVDSAGDEEEYTPAEATMTLASGPGSAFTISSEHGVQLMASNGCDGWNDEYGFAYLTESDSGSSQYTWYAPGTQVALLMNYYLPIGTTTASAGPIISYIDPSSISTGQTTTLTIYGSGFGSNPTVNGSSTGVTINTPYIYVSDSEIQVSVSVDSNAQLGDYPISVTASGSSGLPFTGNPGGSGSGTSSPEPLSVVSSCATDNTTARIIQARTDFAAQCSSAFTAALVPAFSKSSFFQSLLNAKIIQYPQCVADPTGSTADATTDINAPGRPITLHHAYYDVNNSDKYKEDVLVHENVHRWTGWSDTDIFNNLYPYGLRLYNFTSDFTVWIKQGCPSTFNNPGFGPF